DGELAAGARGLPPDRGPPLALPPGADVRSAAGPLAVGHRPGTAGRVRVPRLRGAAGAARALVDVGRRAGQGDWKERAMNFKTTLVLVGLAAAGAGVWYAGERGLLPFTSKATEPESPTRNALGSLSPAALTRIEIRRGDHTTVLAREGGVWSMPGK